MWIMTTVISNTLVASLIALLAVAVGRVGKKPELAHILWAFVLLKLVTPPLFVAPIPCQSSSSRDVAEAPDMPASLAAEATNESPATGVLPVHTPEQTKTVVISDGVTKTMRWNGVQWILLGTWCSGAVLWFSFAAKRLIRFHRIIRFAREPSPEIVEEANRIARLFVLPYTPKIVEVNGRIPPLVTGIGKKSCIALPTALLSSLDAEQLRSVLAHELAHVRRGDQWVRWFELVVVGLFWWHPIAWWARSELRHAEELCCDSWVLRVLPQATHAYAEGLLKTVDYLSGTEITKVVAATGISNGVSLMKRIEQVMECVPNSVLSRRARWGIVLSLLAFLPVGVAATTEEAQKTEDHAPMVPDVVIPDLAPQNISVTPKQPSWIRGNVKVDCLAWIDMSLGTTTSELIQKITAAFESHSSIHRVSSVKIDASNGTPTVRIALKYRRPVLMVRTGDERWQGDCYWPVSSKGFLLPPDGFSPNDTRKYLRANLGGTEHPTGSIGALYGHTAVTEAAAIASKLGNVWKGQVSEITFAENAATKSYVYVLTPARDGITVVWGHAPGNETLDEATASEKVQRFREFVRKSRTKSTFLPTPTTVLDLRPAKAASLTDGTE
ncbi:MAG: M56 family metallopeptidase [Planctomycetota bacterium]